MKANIYPAGEVAFILRQALGPLREWSECLTDMRLDRTSLDGFQLRPTCSIKISHHWRPGYDAANIAAFVREIRALHPEIATHTPVRGVQVEISPFDERAWRHRKLPVMAS
jgi:hypothetical protein